MEGLQLIVTASTIIIFILSAVLAASLSAEFMRGRKRSHLFWSAGMWLFAVTVLFEVIFAYGFYSALLIDAHLLLVAVLVELLALGSMELTGNSAAKWAYGAFCIAATAFLAYALATSAVGNVIASYVVFGALPLLVVEASSIATFPAAAILIIVAGVGYARRRNPKMLSIIAGTVVVSIAGTLYIAAVPEFLYIAEFAGIVLLWLGFFDFSVLKRKGGQRKR